MEHQNPLVSIIIPVYNKEAYIEETIKSALNQTWSNLEIIIVDDGSTDNSLAIAKKQESGKIRIYQQANNGASSARNLGIRVAKGDYIQFLDADDLLINHKIESQLALSASDNSLFLGPTIYFKNGTNPYNIPVKNEWFQEGSTNPTDFLIKLYGGDLIGPDYGGMIPLHSWLTPKKIIEKVGIWNEKLSFDDDGEYFCRVILGAERIIYAENAIVYYRKHVKNSLSSLKSIKALTSHFESVLLKKEHLLNKDSGINAKKAISRCFNEIAIDAYPKSIKIANKAIKEANRLAILPNKFYQHTTFYKFISSWFGWKTSAWISYLKNLNR